MAPNWLAVLPPMFSWFRNRRRRKLLAEPFPSAWRKHLSGNVWQYAQLSAVMQRKLRDKLRIMVAEKHWEGCDGQEITDEIKVTIAAQASLLLLGVHDTYCFDGVPTILVYPGVFSRSARAQHGVLVNDEQTLSGEAWHRGPIVVSWRDVVKGGRNAWDGRNVVLHEFAHHLDGLDGEMGGSPPQANRGRERRWQEVIQREYERLCRQAAQGLPALLDYYGATNKAEFFAVATECFFERAEQMRDQLPELYAILQDFYQQDPAAWQAELNEYA